MLRERVFWGKCPKYLPNEATGAVLRDFDDLVGLIVPVNIGPLRKACSKVCKMIYSLSSLTVSILK